MSKGESVCNRLKFIRKRLAEQNGIDYKVEKCPNSGNCQEGTCPFCEQEAEDLSALLLAKEECGEKVIWDVSIDDYDPSTLYGDDVERIPNDVDAIHELGIVGREESPLIDVHLDTSTLEKIAGYTTTMGMCSEVMKLPDDMLDITKELDGYVPNPNKKFPEFKPVVAPWYEIHNENQDSSISLENSSIPKMKIKDDIVIPPEFDKVPFNFNETLMGDVSYTPEKVELCDASLATILTSLNDFGNESKIGIYDGDVETIVSHDPRDLDGDDFDKVLIDLQYIHKISGAKFSEILSAYLREKKSVEKAIEYLTTRDGYVKAKFDEPEKKSENAASDDERPITIETIKAVRQATYAGLGYCKKFLQQCKGDVEKAIEEIRKKPEPRAMMGKVVRDDKPEKK